MITQHFKQQIVMCYFIWFIECADEHILIRKKSRNQEKSPQIYMKYNFEWRQNQGKMRKIVFKSIMPQIDYKDLGGFDVSTITNTKKSILNDGA